MSSDVEDALRTDIPHVYVHVDRDHEAMAHLNDVRYMWADPVYIFTDSDAFNQKSN